jgi:septal ring factor EnvC (AmiA/AmiB activator)
MEKLTLKNITIVILSVSLLLIFYLTQNKKIRYNDKQIEKLHNANDSIININKRLNDENKKLVKSVEYNKELLIENENKITKAEKKIDSLLNEKSKIYISVYRMSASDVSRSFTDYLNERK